MRPHEQADSVVTAQISAADAVVFACPEYNTDGTGAERKETIIDWLLLAETEPRAAGQQAASIMGASDALEGCFGHPATCAGLRVPRRAYPR